MIYQTVTISTARAFRSDPNISIRIGSDRGFWLYRKRSDRIGSDRTFFGGDYERIGSDRTLFFTFGVGSGRIEQLVGYCDRIGSDRIDTCIYPFWIKSDRKLYFSGASDREFLEFKPSN